MNLSKKTSPLLGVVLIITLSLLILTILIIGIFYALSNSHRQAAAPTPTPTIFIDPSENLGYLSSPIEAKLPTFILENQTVTPPEITLVVGENVFWSNQDSQPHKVEIEGTSATLQPLSDFMYTATNTGEFVYSVTGFDAGTLYGKVIVVKERN